MIPKLRTNANTDGRRCSSASHRSADVAIAVVTGILTSMISRVRAMANTPSQKVSSRAFTLGVAAGGGGTRRIYLMPWRRMNCGAPSPDVVTESEVRPAWRVVAPAVLIHGELGATSCQRQSIEDRDGEVGRPIQNHESLR